MTNNNSIIENKISNVMWQMKGIAIISVVFAHCNIQVDGFGLVYLQRIISNIGSIGVGVFLFTAGYYFKPCESDVISFVKQKIKTLIIPWIIASSLIWLYIVLRKGGISANAYLNYVLGNGSIYYYMTDYSIILVLFCLIDKFAGIKNWTCISIIAIGQFFLILEVLGYSIFPTPYLDFLYFSAFFSLGCMIKKYINELLHLPNGMKNVFKAGIFLILLVLLMPFEVSYFANYFSLALEMFAIITLFFTCLSIENSNRILYRLGKNSFSIYLWHLPFAGIISKIGSHSVYTAYMSVLWPALILCIVNFAILLIKKFINPNYYYMFGLR